jgi:hypothetical protein
VDRGPQRDVDDGRDDQKDASDCSHQHDAEVIAAVDEGRMALTTATKLSEQPEEVQRQQARVGQRRRAFWRAIPGVLYSDGPCPASFSVDLDAVARKVRP